MRPRILIVAAITLLTTTIAAPDSTTTIANALHQSLARTNATAIVLDVATNRVLATENPIRAAQQLAAPGSVLKPFYLLTAISSGIVQPDTAVHCTRHLHIAGHTLNCGHPPDPSALNARQALAYSCNTYFATLGRHLTTTQLLDTLHLYNLGESTHLFANESAARIITPISTADRQLFVLGITGIRVTAAQIAVAYRRLALAHRDHTEPPAATAVWQGLEDSVDYGTSNSASVPWMITAGKTGTASNPNSARTHGWFVGIAPAASPRIILVLYIPNGTGGDAASLARRFYQAARPILQ